MTRDEILALKPGRELDALVAEKVMGLQVVASDWPCGRNCESGRYEATSFPDGENFYDTPDHVYVPPWGQWPPVDRLGRFAIVEPVPFYSTNMSATWEVVDKMWKLGECPDIRWSDEEGCWWCELSSAGANGDTAPEAICKAALLAVMEEGEKRGS